MNDLDNTHLSLDSRCNVPNYKGKDGNDSVFDVSIDCKSVQNVVDDFWLQNENKMMDELRSTKTEEKKYISHQYLSDYIQKIRNSFKGPNAIANR